MGSGKKVTVGYRYYMGLQFGICHGPVDSLHQIIVGDREAWNGSQTTGGSLAIDAPELFGGDKREGGIVGVLDVAMGESTQTENSYLVSQLGAAIPAFRGILSAIWRGGQVSSNNPYVKPWAFRVKRILQGWSTGAAWYPEKAEIPLLVESNSYSGYLSHVTASNQLTGQPYPSTDIPVPVMTNATVEDIARAAVDTRNTNYIAGAGPSAQQVYYISSSYNPSTKIVSAIGNDTGNNYPPGTTVASVGEVEMICASGGASSWDGSGVVCSTSSSIGAMNPAHIIYECITDSAWGMGYPTSSIDSASFTAAADALYAEGFGLSFLWSQQETIENFVQIVLDHIGALLYVRPDTGAFALKLIRSDYDRGTLAQYGPGNLIAAEDYQRQAWGETINEVTVIYTDLHTGKDSTVTAQDMANIEIQGGAVAQTRNYPGIQTSTLAQRVAMRDIQSVSTPLARIKLTATRAAWQVFPGDVFRLTWPEYDIDDVVYRVLAVNRGTLQDGAIVIDAVEDVFGLPTNTYLAEQPGEWVEPSGDAAAAPYRKLLESPYWDLARNLSAADLDYVDPLAGYLETLAVRPNGVAINYGIHARTGAADYAEIGNGDFCPSATVVAALSKTTTAISLENAVDLDLVVAGGYAVIDAEYVLVSAIDAVDGVATISRGVLDTVPTEHAAGARIWFADSWQGVSSTEYADAEAIDVKLLTASSSGALSLAAAPVDSLTFDQRHYRPYAPGKVLVNSGAYPEWIDGSAALALSWAHRDRLLQTAYIVEQSEASIGPEAGTTYNLRIYGEEDDLIKTFSGLSGTSQTYATTDETADSMIPASGASYAMTWTPRTSGFGSAAINTIAYDNSGLMVIAGGTSSPLLSTSTDGITWTARTSNLYSGNACIDVAYDGSGMWVAVGSSTSANINIASSPNGMTWTARTSAVNTSLITVHFGGGIWVAGGGSGNVTTSTNGAGWTLVTSNFGSDHVFGSCYGAGLHVIVGGSGKLATSSNASSWTLRTSSFGSTQIRCVAYGGGLFIAGGASGKLATSSDGISWSQVSGGFGSAQIESIDFDAANGVWMLSDAAGNIGISTDGTTWALIDSGFSGSPVYAVRRCGSQWVEAGGSGKLSTSPGLEFDGYRLNGRLRFELESVRGGLVSYQKHNHTVLREGYGFNYGYYYGGQ